MLQLLSLYNDDLTAVTVTAERTFLSELNGGCQVPIGAYAVRLQSSDGTEEQNIIQLTGMVATPDGSIMLKETMQGTDPVALGIAVAAQLKSQGADRILAEVRG